MFAFCTKNLAEKPVPVTQTFAIGIETKSALKRR